MSIYTKVSAENAATIFAAIVSTVAKDSGWILVRVMDTDREAQRIESSVFRGKTGEDGDDDRVLIPFEYDYHNDELEDVHKLVVGKNGHFEIRIDGMTDQVFPTLDAYAQFLDTGIVSMDICLLDEAGEPLPFP